MNDEPGRVKPPARSKPSHEKSQRKQWPREGYAKREGLRGLALMYGRGRRRERMKKSYEQTIPFNPNPPCDLEI